MSKNSKSGGCSFGSLGCAGFVAAAVLSWISNKSIVWLILHFFCGWIYVIYWALCKTELYSWLCSVAR